MKDYTSVKEILSREGRLIQLPARGKVVFVGDTHGDLDATETIFKSYFQKGYTIVFLGDYVDRGIESRENIEFLLQKKLENPRQVFLLAGNHEGYCTVPFSPADFWEELNPEDYELFSLICQSLPFAVVTKNGVVGLHGAIPDVRSLDELNTVQTDSERWHQLMWGDFIDEQGNSLGDYGGRPLFGRDYFMRVMQQLGMNVLIRSHQPHIEPVIFNKRCVTLMTSHAYTLTRSIAIVDLEQPFIESADDLDIVEI
jgi:hypothetical protein